MRRTRQLQTLAVYCGPIGALLFTAALVLGVVSDFWRSNDRCTYAPMPQAALQSERSLSGSFPTLVPLGYGCSWKAKDGPGTVPAVFPNWPLTVAAGGGVVLMGVAAVVFGYDRARPSANR